MHLAPSTIETLRHALQLARLATFLAFIVLGVRIIRTDGAVRRRAVNMLIIFVLLVQAALIVGQNEAWPFAMYPMMAVRATDRATPHNGLSFRVVDDTGREWPVDPLAWSPLYPQSVMGWFEVTYPRVGDNDRTAAMRFLLERAEVARSKAIRGKRFYGNRALLGPLAAPDTNLYSYAPPSPRTLRALRVYRLFWNIDDFARDRRLIARTLICEYRR
jgi:hypothetical protein